MQKNESTTAEQNSTPSRRFGPEWFLIIMGAVFIGIIVFEIFFKTKP